MPNRYADHEQTPVSEPLTVKTVLVAAGSLITLLCGVLGGLWSSAVNDIKTVDRLQWSKLAELEREINLRQSRIDTLERETRDQEGRIREHDRILARRPR